jgi:dihydroorotase
MDSLVMRRAMTYAANFNALIIHHTMDNDLASAGVMHDGELAVRLGLPGIPEAAEVIMIERDLRLMELTGARYHIAQISCAESLKVIRDAKARGLPVTCGVSANHLMLNENDVQNYRTFAKLMPPLRSEQDRLALAEAVGDGTIDVIVSGHNPQGEDAKRRPFEEAEYGSVGVETLLAASLSLYHDGIASLDRLITALTATPASLLGLETGNLNIGSRADFSLLDLDAPWVVDGNLLHSRSKNAAIEGRKLQGKVMETVVAGQTIFRAEND